MNPDHDAPAPVDAITELFLREYRQGRDPDIEVFCRQYPDLRELRAVLSMAIMLEEARPQSTAGENPGGEAEKGQPIRERLGDYRLIRQAGSGGMGVVYEAIQESLGRRVAVKTLPSGVSSSPAQLKRFLQEARAVASLHHTNIVPVFAVGQDDGIHYYVMPFIDGMGLERILARLKSRAHLDRQHRHLETNSSAYSLAETVDPGEYSGSADEPRETDDRNDLQSELDPQVSATRIIADWETSHFLDAKSAHRSGLTSAARPARDYWLRVADIGLQVAEALHYANQQGFVHRDVKPSNLLLDHDGIVWLTDFGLAKAADSGDLTQEGQMLGTLRYLAPERLQGVHDLRGDIYGLGATMYELLTLRSPYDAIDKPELVQQVLGSKPPPARTIDPLIPVDLETIVQKAIAKDPRDRYQTAESMAEDLKLFLEDRPIMARRSGVLERCCRWCRRNPAISSLSACIAVLMMTTISVLFATNARIVRETRAKSAALQAKNLAYAQRERAYQRALQSELLANRRFYAAQVDLAGQAFQQRQVTYAEDLLGSVLPRAQEPDFRGFEWHYLLGALHQGLQQTLHHKGNEITALSFAPDGGRLLIGGGNDQSGFAQLTDVRTGQRLFERNRLDCIVGGCAYSPDGSMFALALGDGRLQVFSVASLDEVYCEETGVKIKSLDWSPNGKLLGAGSETGELLLWKTPGFEAARIANAHQGPVLRVFFSRDSARLYSSTDSGGEGKMSRRWDALKWPPVQSRSFSEQSISDESPDRRTLVGLDWGTLQRIDAETGQVIASKQISTGPLVSARYHLDGQALLVAARTDRAVRKLDPVSLNVLQVTAQDHVVSALAIGPTGRYWAAGDSKGEVRIWNLKSPRIQSDFIDPDVRTAFFLPDEDAVLLGGAGASRLWSTQDGSTRPFHRGMGLRAISRDGKTLVCVTRDSAASKSATVEVWMDGREAPERIAIAGPIFQQCLAVSASGRWLATRTEGSPITIHDLSRSPAVPVQSLDAPCYHFAFSPDERWLVGGQQYGVISCFDVATGARLPSFAEFDSFWAWGMSIAFSPEGRYVAAGNESGTVRVWETESRRLIASLSAQPGEIRSLVFFPDERRLVAGGTGDVRIWDFQSGQELLGLPVTGGLVEALALNHAGDTLVAVTPQGVTHAWVGKPE